LSLSADGIEDRACDPGIIGVLSLGLVENLEAIRPRELTSLIVIQIHEESVRDGPRCFEPELYVRLKLGNQPGLARDLQSDVTGPKQCAVAPEAHGQIGEGAPHTGQILRRQSAHTNCKSHGEEEADP
jgi:hypothetical protein